MIYDNISVLDMVRSRINRPRDRLSTAFTPRKSARLCFCLPTLKSGVRRDRMIRIKTRGRSYIQKSV